MDAKRIEEIRALDASASKANFSSLLLLAYNINNTIETEHMTQKDWLAEQTESGKFPLTIFPTGIDETKTLRAQQVGLSRLLSAYEELKSATAIDVDNALANGNSKAIASIALADMVQFNRRFQGNANRAAGNTTANQSKVTVEEKALVAARAAKADGMNEKNAGKLFADCLRKIYHQ